MNKRWFERAFPQLRWSQVGDDAWVGLGKDGLLLYRAGTSGVRARQILCLKSDEVAALLRALTATREEGQEDEEETS